MSIHECIAQLLLIAFSVAILALPNAEWGEAVLAWGKTRYWWLQLTTIIPLLGFYAFNGQGVSQE